MLAFFFDDERVRAAERQEETFLERPSGIFLGRPRLRLTLALDGDDGERDLFSSGRDGM